MGNNLVFFCSKLQLCLAILLVSSAVYAEKEDKKETKKKAEPLEKKLDKRGLLNLGYGYGINGLDVGYIGNQGQYGGAYHSAPIAQSSHYGGYDSPAYAGYASHGGYSQHAGYSAGHGGYSNQGGYVSQGYGGDDGGIYLGHKTNVQKTVTIVKGIPYPVEHIKHIPVIQEKHVPYPVKVGVPQPYEVIHWLFIN